MRVHGWALAATMAVAGLASRPAAVDEPQEIRCGVEMRNVALHLADGIVLRVRTLDGEFISQRRGTPPVFDDPRSYVLRLRSADLALDAASLTNLLSRHALASRESSIRDVRVTIENGALHVRGKLHRGITAPFSMVAAVSAADDGAMRLRAEKLKALGLPVKGLFDLLGIDVADLVRLPRDAGIRADGDDLLIDTAAVLPPPRTEGRLQHVAIVGERLTMQMTGSASPPPRPKILPLPSARNYLYFFGGSIRFGKLTMSDADMQLIDANPRDPFDFFPTRYEAQLLAGYSRNTARKGLQVFMPDYARVAAGKGRLTPPPIS